MARTRSKLAPWHKQRDILLWFAGLFAGLSIMAVPQLFPDLSRMILWGCFLGGAALSAAFLVGGIFIGMSRQLIVTTLCIIGAAAWILWPSDVFDSEMPGLTIYVHERLYDTPEFTDRYLFKISNDDGASASLYISSSGLFTFSVRDVYKSTYNLEARLYRTEIPIDEWVMLFCEVGVLEGKTYLRIVTNDREIRRRTLPAAIYLGNKKWSAPKFGDGVPYFFFGAVVTDKTIPTSKIRDIVQNTNQRLRGKS
jgi:hypothetical protein